MDKSRSMQCKGIHMKNRNDKEGEANMSNIDILRNKLHKSIERGNMEEILTISQELDVQIVKFMKKEISF